MPNSSPIVVDATVLSNLASTDSVWLLNDLFSNPITVSAVETEIYNGIADGYTFLQNAADEFGNDLPVRTSNFTVSPRLQRELDRGEAHALHVAHRESGILATDDMDARDLADDLGVSCTGSIGILVRAVDDGAIVVSTADNWHRTWCSSYGYRSPVSSISSYMSSL